MSRFLVRLLFCFIPAIPVGIVGMLIGGWVGSVLAAGCVFGLGLQVTQARPERGERP